MPKTPRQTYSDLELVARAIWRDYRLTQSELLRMVAWRGIYAAQLRSLTRQLIQLGAITSSQEKPPWKRRRQVYTWVWGISQATEPTDEEIIWGFRRFCDFLRQQQPDAESQEAPGIASQPADLAA